MTNLQQFATVGIVVLLIPVALLWVVRLAARVAPPISRAWHDFATQHRRAVALFEALVWLSWLLLSFSWAEHWSNWHIRAVDVLFALEAMNRALHARRQTRLPASPAV